ncbi:MAG TPA: hypothetical protein IAC02_02110 [Candidatus Coprovivens excrementavium]|nr:hypothetical protein [Candidatus Coprovivens excrementavium]
MIKLLWSKVGYTFMQYLKFNVRTIRSMFILSIINIPSYIRTLGEYVYKAT